MKSSVAALTVGLVWIATTNAAKAVTIYDGTNLAQPKPDQQGWTYKGTTIYKAPSVTTSNDGITLDSGNPLNYAGYFKLSPIALDCTKGYSFTIQLKINSESHSSNNRAGFSVIAMCDIRPGETQPYGIELGFWTSNNINTIFAQNVGFNKGETAAFNTQGAITEYNLVVKDNKYQLFANKSAQPILQGSLRQYTGFTPPPGYQNPYTTSRLIFAGDNTTSATANWKLKRVDVAPITQFP
ncbi:MAG TPA: hypothetical protein DDZ80_27950 [Cyanobacteria bacterium UBA8803]|nr:hypothetical protein [Cyanobacteria bacterium UBA9273]HBL62098.1 hypothetical protein [Cyanobacteria bacterium UBA8803]